MVADELFNEAKRISKIKLDISKRKLGEIDDELRATFEAMEKVRSFDFPSFLP